jgi:hypothetical protein
MGAWGCGIFDNDTACNIRDAVMKEVRQGFSIDEAIHRYMEKHSDYDLYKDFDAVLAIAAIQMEQKRLQPGIKRICLNMINEKRGIEDWNDPKKRIQVLEKFKAKLIKM